MNPEKRSLEEIKRLNQKMFVLYSLLQKDTDKNSADIRSFEKRVDDLAEITETLNELLAGQDIEEFLDSLRKAAQLANSYLPIGVNNSGEPDPNATKRILWNNRGDQRWLDFGGTITLNLSSGVINTDTIATHSSDYLTLPNNIQTQIDGLINLRNCGIYLPNNYPISIANAWKSVDTSLIEDEETRRAIMESPERFPLYYLAETYKYGQLNYSNASADNRANALVTVKYLDEFYKAPETSQFLQTNHNADSIYWDNDTGYLTMNSPNISSPEGGILNLNRLTFRASVGTTDPMNYINNIASLTNYETIDTDKDKALVTLAVVESKGLVNAFPKTNPDNTVQLNWNSDAFEVIDTGVTSRVNPHVVIRGNTNETSLTVTTAAMGSSSVNIYPNGLQFSDGPIVNKVLISTDEASEDDAALVTAGYIKQHSEDGSKLRISLVEGTSIDWYTSDAGLLDGKTLLSLKDSTEFSNGIQLLHIYGTNDNATKLSELSMRMHGGLAFDNEAMVTNGTASKKLDTEIVGIVNEETMSNIINDGWIYIDRNGGDKTIPTVNAVKNMAENIVENYYSSGRDLNSTKSNIQILVNNTNKFIKNSTSTEPVWPAEYMNVNTLIINNEIDWNGLKAISKSLANNLKLYFVKTSSDINSRDRECNQVIEQLNEYVITGKSDNEIADWFNEFVIMPLYNIELMLLTNDSTNIVPPQETGDTSKADKLIEIPLNTNLAMNYDAGDSEKFDNASVYAIYGTVRVRIPRDITQQYDYLIVNVISLEINVSNTTVLVGGVISELNDNAITIEFDISRMITGVIANVNDKYPISLKVARRDGTQLQEAVTSGESVIHIHAI